MELKVVCQCGQKYKFDVEPVGGRMPFTVTCPICKTDGTTTANSLLAQSAPPPLPTSATFIPTAPPPPPPISAGLRMNRQPEPATQEALAPSLAPIAPPVKAKPVSSGGFNLGLGIVGALVGAGVGVGLMLAFAHYAGFRFPFTGVGVGALTGYSARLLGKGGNPMLGGISGGLAALATVGSIFAIYDGNVPPPVMISSVISMVVSVSFAFRIAKA